MPFFNNVETQVSQVGFPFLHRLMLIVSTLLFKQVNHSLQPVDLTFGPLPLSFVAPLTADPTTDHLPSHPPGFSSSSSPGFPLTTESSPASSTVLHYMVLYSTQQCTLNNIQSSLYSTVHYITLS